MEKRILVATLIFPREKSRFVLLSSSSSSVLLMCGPRPRGVTLVPDPDCVFCGNHSPHIHTHAQSHLHARTNAKRNGKKSRKILFSYGLLGCAQH